MLIAHWFTCEWWDIPWITGYVVLVAHWFLCEWWDNTWITSYVVWIAHWFTCEWWDITWITSYVVWIAHWFTCEWRDNTRIIGCVVWIAHWFTCEWWDIWLVSLFIFPVPELCLPSAEGFSKQDLAVCIASISSMALTGVDSGLPRLGSTESYQLTSGDVSSSTSPTSVSTVDSIRAVKKKLRRRLRRHRSESVEDRSLAEHVAKHIELLDSLEKDVRLSRIYNIVHGEADKNQPPTISIQ